MDEKDLSKLSKKELESYLKKNPKLLSRYAYLSSIFEKIVKLKKAKMYDEMLILLNKALRKYPNNNDLITGKAWVLCALQYNEDCVEFCKRMLKKSKNPEILKWKFVAENRVKEVEEIKKKA